MSAEERLAKVNKIDLYLVTFFIAGVIAACTFAFSHTYRGDRYIGYTAGVYVYVLDKTTGTIVRQCGVGICEAVGNH